ncbi:MAG: nucleotide pyrophosphohydrolase [Armatimonadota bacterium]
MNDDTTTIAEIRDALRRFARERDWEQFHNPKDLAVALSIEAAEVLEHFRFRSSEEVARLLRDEERRRALADELADVASFAVRLADVARIDLAEAIERKMQSAAEKYPAELVRGKPHKYTHYLRGSPERGEQPQ